MAFPTNERDLEVSFAYGANLASDLTTLTYGSNLALTHVQPRVTITRGRFGGAQRTQPTQIDFGLKNPAGVFSPRNIVGPHYGQLRRNTPVRVRLDPGGGMVTRAIAYLPDWPVRWTGPDIDDNIPMQAAGSLRRLGAGRDSKSALRRTIQSWAPKAYWALEDGPRSLVYGAPNLDTRGAVEFGSVNDLVGAATAPNMAAGQLYGSVPRGISNTSWHCQFAIKPSALPAVGVGVFRIRTDSPLINVFHFFIPFVGDDRVQVFIDDDAGAGPLVGLSYSTAGAWLDPNWHHIGIGASQSGGTATFKLYVDGVLGSTSTASAILGSPTWVELNQNWDTGALVSSITHVEFGDGPLPAGYFDAMKGYLGELASTRFARLCAEESIACDVAAGITESMGPQRPGVIVDLLHECEDSDEAVIVERRTGVLGFDPRSGRYNRSVVMTVPYMSIAAIDPDDDDRDLRNSIRVTSTFTNNGATMERSAETLGSDSATGVGRYADAVSRSLASDDSVIHHAGWLTGAGIVDEPRYTIGLNLRGHPELVTQWLACDVGSRILVTNPPAIQVGPAPLDLVIEGYQELLDGVEWYVTLQCLPYRQYEVFQIETGTGNRSRIAAGFSTLDLGYSATATSLSVTSDIRWIDSATYPTKFPIAIVIAGEVMTVTSIVGTGATQTFTVTRGLHGVSKALPIGTLVQLWRPAAIAL